MLRKFTIANNSLAESDDINSNVLMYINPDQGERSELCGAYRIDEHTLSSTLDPDEVARVEFGSDMVSMIWKRPMNCSGKDNFYFNVGSIGFFLIDNRLIVVTTDEISLTGAGGRHAAKFNSPFELLLVIILGTIQHYLEHLKVIKMIAHDLQKRINTSMQNEHLIQMFNLSESLVYYLNAIGANGIALGRLRSQAEKLNHEPKIIEMLDDIGIENSQCYKQAEIYSTVFSGLMDARGSLVNNNMSMLLKNLTIINIVFLPLNLIAGIGGMSEFSMMTYRIDWRISYSLFFAAMIILGWITAYVLSKLNFTSINPFDLFRAKRKWKKQ